METALSMNDGDEEAVSSCGQNKRNKEWDPNPVLHWLEAWNSNQCKDGWLKAGAIGQQHDDTGLENDSELQFYSETTKAMTSLKHAV